MILKKISLNQKKVNQIVDVKAIYDMHRYLMTKHNISP